MLGAAQVSKDTSHIYGPYIRTIPNQPVGANKGQNGIAILTGPTVGWLYVVATGAISANTTTETDDAGALYSSY